MDEVKASAQLPSRLVFRLGTLGAVATDRFAAAIEPYDLKPKHVGLMSALALEVAASQQDLAARLGVVPSLVVSLADHLERLGAVQRVRDPEDRRRQILTLTDHGRTLLTQCDSAALVLDRDLAAQLTAAQQAALHEALAILAANVGLPAGT